MTRATSLIVTIGRLRWSRTLIRRAGALVCVPLQHAIRLSWLHCHPRRRSDENYNPTDTWTLGVTVGNPLIGRVTIFARASTVIFPLRTALHCRLGPKFGRGPVGLRVRSNLARITVKIRSPARDEGTRVLSRADGEVVMRITVHSHRMTDCALRWTVNIQSESRRRTTIGSDPIQVKTIHIAEDDSCVGPNWRSAQASRWE